MNWTFSIQNKLTASAVLLLLCGLVLFSNVNDRAHSRNVKKSISTLYEDRLIAEGYILKLRDGIFRIRETLYSPDTLPTKRSGRMSPLWKDIREQSELYGKTKFTAAESTKFEELKALLSRMEAQSSHHIPSTLQMSNEALLLLSDLSMIQLEESKLIMKRSEKLFQSGKLSSELAFGIVVLILLVLQALVYSSTTLHISNKSNAPHLN